MPGKRVLYAEILIVFVLLAAVLLTQLVGTVDVAQSRGEWRTPDDLKDKVIGMTPVWETETMNMWPYATYIVPDQASDLPNLLMQGTIDAFLANRQEAESIQIGYPELTVMLQDMSMEMESTAELSVRISSSGNQITPIRPATEPWMNSVPLAPV